MKNRLYYVLLTRECEFRTSSPRADLEDKSKEELIDKALKLDFNWAIGFLTQEEIDAWEMSKASTTTPKGSTEDT